MTRISGKARNGLTGAWVAKFALHVSLLFLGFVLAYALRRAPPLIWWVIDPDAIRVVRWAGFYALIGAGVEMVFQSERSAWRYASMREVVGLARNVTITTGLFLCLIFVLERGMQLPRSVLPLAWLVSVALLVGFRMAWRLPHDPGLAAHFLPSWWPRPEIGRPALLIVGSMADADRQLRLLQAAFCISANWRHFPPCRRGWPSPSRRPLYRRACGLASATKRSKWAGRACGWPPRHCIP